MTYKPGARRMKWRHIPGGKVRSFSPQGGQPDLEDAGRREFLQALNAAKLDLTEWETTVASWVKWPAFSNRQRPKIDELMNRFRGRIAWGEHKRLAPVRSQAREAYVPDDAQKLLGGKGS